MSMLEAPRIDDRSAQQIFDQVEEDLRRRLGVNARAEDPMAEALLRVFARYCELIIQRLNRVPEKNYLAFLDTLNLSRIAPVPAQAPLTFSPVKKLPASAGADRRAGPYESRGGAGTGRKRAGGLRNRRAKSR